jgi:hypothetical protein
LRSIFQHRQIIIDRFPFTSVDRFTRRVSINTPIRKHLRNFRFRERTFFVVTNLYVKRSHCLSKDMYNLPNGEVFDQGDHTPLLMNADFDVDIGRWALRVEH